MKENISNLFYTIKYPKKKVSYSFEWLVSMIKTILEKAPFNKLNNGEFIFNVYFNSYYGVIFDVEYDCCDNNYFDVHLIIHVDSIFLYEVDSFDSNSLCMGCELYYYKGKYYFDVDKIDKNTFCKLGEYGEVLYGDDVFDVVNNGVKLRINF